MSQITISVRASFPLGLSFQESFSLYQDSVEQSTFGLASGASDFMVNVAPISYADDLSLLYIQSNLYPMSGSSPLLSYKLHSAGNPSIGLSNAQIFAGEGQLTSLSALPDKLFFSNTSAIPVTISIISARNAASSLSSLSSESSQSSVSSDASISSESSQSSTLSV